MMVIACQVTFSSCGTDMTPPETVHQLIQAHHLLDRGQTVVVGVSGGADSLCLLHLLRDLAADGEITIIAAHLHHGIRGPEADSDAAHVEALCEQWGVPHLNGHADVPALAQERGLSTEEAARQARYAFLAETARAQGADSVAVAHNADDQVETILMHLLRGSGLDGLCGMRPDAWIEEPTRPPGQPRIRLIRPLLSTPRGEIEAYNQAHGIQARFDRSNLDTSYHRNRLRQELIPYLEGYNPNLRRTLLRMGAALSADRDLLDALLDQTWPQVTIQATSDVVRLDLMALRAQPLGIQRAILRRAVETLSHSLRNLGFVHIDDALAVMREGHVGTRATLPAGLMLTLGYDDLTLARQDYELPPIGPSLDAPIMVAWPGVTLLSDGHWQLSLEAISAADLPPDWQRNTDPLLAFLDADRLREPLILRTRRRGDTFWPLGLGHEKALRSFMIDQKIPSPQRHRLPLLTSRDAIAWVVGWRIDQRFAVTASTERIVVARCRPVDRSTMKEQP